MTMFLSKVSLRSHERGGTGALASFLAGAASSIGQGHHLVWSLFEDRCGERPFLYRMTGPTVAAPILIASSVEPHDDHNLWNIEIRPFQLAETLKVGDRIAWSLRVNASVKSRLDTGKERSTKHCIVDRALREKAQGTSWQIAERLVPDWLAPRLAARGIDSKPEDMRVEAYAKRQFGHGPRSRERPVVIAMTYVIGTGVVADADAAKVALRKGVGRAQAYGCGLLLVRRIT